MVVFLKFLAAASLIFAVVIFGYSTPLYIQQNRILRTWPATDATVVSSRIVEHETPSGPLYGTELRFAFDVNGQPVTGEFDFPHESTSRERKEKQTARIPSGRAIAFSTIPPSLPTSASTRGITWISS